MAVLNICNCVLRLKDQLGNPYLTAELVVESRKSQVNSGDAVYLNKPQRSTAKPGIVIQDLIYISKSQAPLTSITVTYTGGGTAGAEVVTVVGTNISIQIQNSVSTATQIRTAVNASAAAVALITVLVSGTGSTAQVIQSSTTLSDDYCLLQLAETTTNSQLSIFTLNWNDGNNYNSIIFDPVMVPNQSYLNLSTTLTVSRG